MAFKVKAKKGGKPDQKVQGKKSFTKGPVKDMSSILSDDDDNMDSDDSSDDAVVMKTPKGKQTPNEKRVSFQVPGKNTPAKTPVGQKQATPAKGNSVSKKQATPGKVDLPKFKGIEKQNKNSKKGFQLEEDDDDDDDDDDEDSDFGGDLDLDMGSDDDDDDDGDDDEDEDDDDEDDDDEDEDDDDDEDEDDGDEESNQRKLKGKNQKQNVVQAKQSPVKDVQTPLKTPKSKDNQSPQSAKKVKDAVSPKQTDAVTVLEEERRKERDAAQLYLGNLPKEITGVELKELSSDIISVNLIKRPKMTNAFAFLQFASEAKAEENLKKLKSKSFKGSTLNVDYVGIKSSRQSKENDQVQYNPKRLYVSGLPLNVTIHQVSKFFPKCQSITLNQSPVFRAATVGYWTEEDATEAFQETRDIKINGVQVSVLHSRMGKPSHSKRKRTANKKNKNKMDNGRSAKKMKLQESDDDE